MVDVLASDLRKLAELRAAGAISEDQYLRFVGALNELNGREGAPTRTPRSPSFLRTAAAAGAGAVAGSLAADLLQSAVVTPPPEVLEVTWTETTTFTDEGYVSYGEIAVESLDGDLIAEGTYPEAGEADELSNDDDGGFVEDDFGDDLDFGEF